MTHEEAFVHSFILQAKQARYSQKLASPKHRREFLSRLDHNLDYDPAFVEQIPGNQTTAMILETLLKLGAPDNCHVIGAGSNLDAKTLPLADALSDIDGQANGVVLSCISGKLAYYESEDGRYLLVKR